MAKFAVGKEIYPELQKSLPPQLPAFLAKQRWFGGKAGRVFSAELAGIIPMRSGVLEVLLLVASVKYADGTEESYAMPVACAEEQSSLSDVDSSFLRVEGRQHGNVLVLTDALKSEEFLKTLLE